MNDLNLKQVNVFHPRTQHSYQLALAVQKAGLLHQFITSIYYKENCFPYNLIHILPKFLSSKSAKEFRRRFLDGLDTKKVKQYPWFEIARLAIEKVGISQYLKSQAVYFCDMQIDRYVRDNCLSGINAVAGFSESCVETFRKAEKIGVQCIMDQTTAYVDFVDKTLKEEMELSPDFAEAISTPKDKKWLEERREEARLADAILCASEFVKQSLVENGINGKKIRMIRYGVNTNRFTLKQRKQKEGKEFIVLFVGSIGPLKGIKYLLEAIKQLNISEIHLQLIGDFIGSTKPYRSYTGFFEHRSRVLNVDLPHFYASADLLVLPSLVEGFGLVALEAMASGLPVIVSENTGVKEIVENSQDGFIVPIRNVEALKEKILFLYEHKELCQEMGLRARKKAEQFSWAQYHDNIGQFFKAFLN